MDAWYDGLHPMRISSFRQLIEVLYNQWDPNIKKEILNIMSDKQDLEDPQALPCIRVG